MALVTNADYIALLLNRLGRRNDTSLRSTIVDELNAAKNRFEYGRFLPWFLMTNASIGATAGNNILTLSTGFLREEEDHQPFLTLTDGNQSQLRKGTFDILQKKYLNAAQGTPQYYALTGDSLALFPTPNATMQVLIFYYEKQALISDDSAPATNPWLTIAGDWIMAEAGMEIASFHLQKADMAQRFAQKAGLARDAIVTAHEARIHTNMNYSDDSEYQTG